MYQSGEEFVLEALDRQASTRTVNQTVAVLDAANVCVATPNEIPPRYMESRSAVCRTSQPMERGSREQFSRRDGPKLRRPRSKLHKVDQDPSS
jgi:hypothetical protein